MTRGGKGKLFTIFVPLFTLSLLSKIVCSLWFDVSVVSAMIYDIHQPTWNQCEPYHDIEASDQISHPLWLVIKFPPSRARKGVKCPGYARGGGRGVDLTDTSVAFH